MLLGFLKCLKARSQCFFLYQKFLAVTKIHATMKEAVFPKVKDTNAHVYKDSLVIIAKQVR